MTRVRRRVPSATRFALRARVACFLLVAVAAAWRPAPALAQFDVTEDEPQVKRVEIVGNEAYGSKTLRSILRTRSKSFWRPWRSAPLRADFVRYDQVALRDFYRRRGYLSARVDSVSLIREKASEVVVRFEIVEGPRAQVQALDFDGPTVEEEEVIRGAIPLSAGGFFDVPQLEASRGIIDSLYAERGRITTAVRDSVEVVGDDVRVAFRIERGPTARLRDVVVEGSDKTKPGFVTREVTLRSGDVLARSRLLRSQQRIYDSGFYNDVQFSTGEVDSATHLTDLVVSVRERRLGWIDAGVGVAYAQSLNPNRDVFRVSGQIGQRNLFRDGIRAIATARLGIRANSKPRFPYVENFSAGERRADVSFTRDWLAGIRIQGTLGAFAEEVPGVVRTDSLDLRPTNPYQAIGASAGLRYELDRYSRVSLVYQPSKVFSDSTTQRTVEGDSIRSYTLNRVVVSVERDTRRNLFDPRRGGYAVASAEFAGGRFGGTAQFLKLSGTASAYRSRGRGITLAVRGRVGVIYSREEGAAAGTGEVIPRLDLIPVNDRFFLGGATSVRGYHDNEIGQVRTFTLEPDGSLKPGATLRGGSFLLLGNAEIRLRPTGFLGAAVFVDAGNVWERPEDVTWRRMFSFSNGAGYKDMKYTAGAGVRLATPVGPVRLDYGWKIRLPRADQPNTVTGRGAFAFSLGQAF